jgi:hypothetical protein
MNLSLEQAIEIHGKALKYRRGARAGAEAAIEHAKQCKSDGDEEGFEVWVRVSKAIERLGAEGVQPSEK